MKKWSRFGRFGVACSALAGTAALAGAVCYHTNLLNNPWCSSFRVIRFGRAANAAFWVALDYKWSLRNMYWGTTEYQDAITKIHLRSALRLREMCSRNAGLFIKVGQHIGALEYLLPREYVKTFKIFHSEAPRTPLKRLIGVIEEELGRPVEEVFSEFGQEPLGAASLAQVHQARLTRDGSIVAVKIQHPDVGTNGYTDLGTMEFLVACVHWVFPEFRFQWLADEVRRNLPIELDFRCEAKNQEKFSSLFKHLPFIKAPEVHWDLTTARLLTMEFCEGVKVDNKDYFREHNINPDEVMLKLGKLYSEMIFQQGFVHCDPHPGNILIRSSKEASKAGNLEVIVLDHGLYTALSDDFRVNYCKLWQALLNEDQAAIKHYCLELQAGALYRLLACMVTARAWAKIEGGITNSRRSTEEMKAIQVNLPRFLPEITQLLDSVPRQLVLILKTNDLLRGIEHSLGASAHRSSYLIMAKSCLRALSAHQVATADSWHTGLYWRIKMRLRILAVQTYELWLQLQHLFNSITPNTS